MMSTRTLVDGVPHMQEDFPFLSINSLFGLCMSFQLHRCNMEAIHYCIAHFFCYFDIRFLSCSWFWFFLLFFAGLGEEGGIGVQSETGYQVNKTAILETTNLSSSQCMIPGHFKVGNVFTLYNSLILHFKCKPCPCLSVAFSSRINVMLGHHRLHYCDCFKC